MHTVHKLTRRPGKCDLAGIPYMNEPPAILDMSEPEDRSDMREPATIPDSYNLDS